MSFAVTVMQTLSAFVIFAAGFVVLLVATICAAVLAGGIYKACQLMRAHTVRTPCQSPAQHPRIEGRTSEF
jgi:hypothetical protein